MNKSEIMQIQNPQDAWKAIATSESPMDEILSMAQEYAEKNGIEIEDMAYYPDGKQVLSQEMF